MRGVSHTCPCSSRRQRFAVHLRRQRKLLWGHSVWPAPDTNRHPPADVGDISEVSPQALKVSRPVGQGVPPSARAPLAAYRPDYLASQVPLREGGKLFLPVSTRAAAAPALSTALPCGLRAQ